MTTDMSETAKSAMSYGEWAETRRDLVETLNDSHEIDPETFEVTANKLREHVDEHPHHLNSYIGGLFREKLRRTTPEDTN